MRGLKTQEQQKFVNYFSLVQSAAERQGCVFFLYAGDGNDFETDNLEGETLMGWLIPKRDSHKFEDLWSRGDPSDDWSDYFTWADWADDKGKINVSFR